MVEINESFVSKGSSSINSGDVGQIVGKERIIHKKLKSLDPKKYKGFAGEIRLLFSMLKDYWNGEYREIPWIVICAIAFALLYFINPWDLIPDYIPGFGYLDDAAVVKIVLSSIKHQVKQYRNWKFYRV